MFECLGKITDIVGINPYKILKDAKCDVKSLTKNTAASHNRILYVQRVCEILGIFSAENVLKLYNSYWDAYLNTMRLYDGVTEVFEMLKLMGIKIGFCTDLTANIQLRKIQHLGISDIPNAMVTSEECGAEKPNSLMFNCIMKKLGTSSNECVMIGDDYEKDICGAAALGINGIWLNMDLLKNVNECVCVSDFYELKKTLERIFML